MADTELQHPLPTTTVPRSRAEAALLAVAAGDALGWPQEILTKRVNKPKKEQVSVNFQTWIRRSGGRFYPHEEVIEAGEYSDDTQLTLSVARCRIIGGDNWWRMFTKTELPLWLLYERGGGSATKRAAKSWVNGKPPWKGSKNELTSYFRAGGNGVAMRIIPHTIVYAKDPSPLNLLHDVCIDGVATHGHPRALVGAAIYAYSAWWLLRTNKTLAFGELVEHLLKSREIWGRFPVADGGPSDWLVAADQACPADGYRELWSKVTQEMVDLLEVVHDALEIGAIADDNQVLESLGCLGKSKGAGTISAAASIYLCARYASLPIQGILKAAFAHGTDTDTVAAMTGGLLGCLAGEEWLPGSWTNVQDFDYIRTLASQIRSGFNPQRIEFRAITVSDLDNFKSTLRPGSKESIDIGGFREAKVVSCSELKSLSDTTLADLFKLRTSDGQNIYITKLGRRKKEHRARMAKPLEISKSDHGLGHLTITTDNLGRVRYFYTRLLNLKPDLQADDKVVYGYLKFVQRKKTEGSRRPIDRLERFHQGLVVEVWVPSISEILCRFEDQGFKHWEQVDRDSKEEPYLRCRDPEGIPLEIREK